MRFSLPSLLPLSFSTSLSFPLTLLISQRNSRFLLSSSFRYFLPALRPLSLLPLSVPFAFSMLLRVASVLSRQPPALPTVVVVVVVVDGVARPLSPPACLAGWLTLSLSVNHPPRRTFPTSHFYLRHPRSRPPSATRRRVRLSYRERAANPEPPNGKCN